MKWKFWDKAQAPTREVPAWPSDAYQSVKYLFGFYAMPDSMPFHEWKSPLVNVSPALEDTVKIAVRALQTRFYFLLLERHIGILEAEIAKDAFLGLLTQLSDDSENDLGRMTRFLLDMIDDALKTAERQGETIIKTPSGDVAVPPEYFMALHILVRMPDSPYYNLETDPQFGEDDSALAECLVHGKDAAKTFFTPMIEAVTTFDVSQFPEWAWRRKPGAYERQLQRRHKNMLFPAARRVVTTADVLSARRKDAADYKALVDKCGALDLSETLPRHWKDYLNNIREQIDELKARARQIGGDTTKIIDHLNSTRRDMGNVWRECMKNNPEVLRLYEIAEAAAREYDEMFRGDFGNQLLRDDPTIPASELVPSGSGASRDFRPFNVLSSQNCNRDHIRQRCIFRDFATCNRIRFSILALKSEVVPANAPEPLELPRNPTGIFGTEIKGSPIFLGEGQAWPDRAAELLARLRRTLHESVCELWHDALALVER
jgi:hypothetical protein